MNDNKKPLPNYYKEDHVFMLNYDVKEMSFFCGDDTCFVATFVANDGQRFEFKMSRAKVMEHVERTSAHPEKYLTNKGLVVAHFHRMAKYWYAMAHLPRCVKQAMGEYNQPIIKVFVKGEKAVRFY